LGRRRELTLEEVRPRKTTMLGVDRFQPSKLAGHGHGKSSNLGREGLVGGEDGGVDARLKETEKKSRKEGMIQHRLGPIGQGVREEARQRTGAAPRKSMLSYPSFDLTVANPPET
jgi:hypothetical protein